MSTAKKDALFCKILSEFTTDLYKSYPDNSLLLFINAVNALSVTTPGIVVENFMLCIEPYKEYIRNKDPSFLLNGMVHKHIEREKEYSWLGAEIEKICDIWKRPETPVKTKDAIFKYIQLLAKIGGN